MRVGVHDSQRVGEDSLRRSIKYGQYIVLGMPLAQVRQVKIFFQG